jgi:predicted PurR-regulated permease PerM
MNHRGGHVRRRRTENVARPAPVLPQLNRLIVSAAGVLLIFYYARSVVLPILLAWVGSMALAPLVIWLRARHVPAPLAAGLILVLLSTGLACGLIHFGRPVADWVKSAPETLPRLREKYQRLFGPISRMRAALYDVDGKSNDNKAAASLPAPGVGGSQIAGTLFTWTGSMLACACETGVLLFVMLAAGDRLIYKLAHVMPAFCHPADTVEISRQIQHHISRYLFSVSLINIVLGFAVGMSLHWAGLPNAAMWGAVAAVVNFIPYFGPVAGMIAVAGAGLLAFDTISQGLLPAGAYLLWHLLEADLVTPFLLGRRFQMNAFVIFVMLMFCALLWGFLGTLLAMPLLVSLNVLCSRVPAFSRMAEFLST